LAGPAPRLGADHKGLPGRLDGDFLQVIQVRLETIPFTAPTPLLQAGLQFLQKDQRQKTAEHVTANCDIDLVIEGPILQDGFDRPKDLFHPPQFLVPQGDLLGRQVQVRPEDPQTIVFLLGLALVLIDLKAAARPRGLEGLALALVAHESFVALLQLVPQRRDNRLAIFTILFRLIGVAADPLARGADLHLLDLQRRGVFARGLGTMPRFVRPAVQDHGLPYLWDQVQAAERRLAASEQRLF
jgi:hypothetical protein